MNITIKMICMLLLYCGYAVSQTDTLRLTTAQAEQLFIQQNLELIAQRLEIDIAEAQIVQARLWPNPSLSIEDVNLWRTDDFRDEMADIFDIDRPNEPRRQFAIGIEQTIITAGKRRKLIEIEKVTRDIAIKYFEELLRGMKIELRTACAELFYLQQYKNILEKEQVNVSRLLDNYRRQVQQGNISRAEMIRLQALLLEIRAEIKELFMEVNDHQRDLKLFLNLPVTAYIEIVPDGFNPVSFANFPFENMVKLAEDYRADLQEAIFERTLFERTLSYERAQRIPDIDISAIYNRADGVGANFVGFGISMDLPFFDRNQGAIKAARIGIQQAQTMVDYKLLEIRAEIEHARKNYTLAYDFNQEISGIDNDFVQGLDDMMDSYTRNFENRNIGILDYLDFFEAWKEGKRTVFEAKKNLRISYEELQFAVGMDFSDLYIEIPFDIEEFERIFNNNQ